MLHKQGILNKSEIVINQGTVICKCHENVTNETEDCQQSEYGCTISSQETFRTKQISFMNLYEKYNKSVIHYLICWSMFDTSSHHVPKLAHGNEFFNPCLRNTWKFVGSFTVCEVIVAWPLQMVSFGLFWLVNCLWWRVLMKAP